MKKVLIALFIMLLGLNLFTQDIDQNKVQIESAIKVEVKKIELGTFKEFTNYEGEIYPYKKGDNSVMKIVLQNEDNEIISKSQDISISFKGIKGNFSWKKPSRGSNILVSNESLKLSTGMKAIVRVLAKTHKNVIVLPENKVFRDLKGSYVFIADGNKAKKVYLSLVYTHEHKVLVKSGLSVKDEIIIFEIISSGERNLRKKIENIRDGVNIEVMDKDLITGEYIKRESVNLNRKKIEKTTKNKEIEDKRKVDEFEKIDKQDLQDSSTTGSKLSFSKLKGKLDFEVSLGFSKPELKEIYYRDSGIDSIINQYAQFYKATPSSSGEFGEIKSMLPFNFTINYNLKKNLYLKNGF